MNGKEKMVLGVIARCCVVLFSFIISVALSVLAERQIHQEMKLMVLSVAIWV